MKYRSFGGTYMAKMQTIVSCTSDDQKAFPDDS